MLFMFIWYRKVVKVKVNETHKWHVNGDIIDRQPKLGDEEIDAFFKETIDSPTDLKGERGSEKASDIISRRNGYKHEQSQSKKSSGKD